jgi:phosphatidate cytidylyltransferase
MFTTRFVTAGLALVLFLAALFFLSRLWWSVFLFPGLLLAAREWGALAGYSRRGALSYACIVTLSGAAILAGPGGAIEREPPLLAMPYILAAAFWLLVAPAWLRRQWHLRHALLLGAAGWLVLVPTWVALVRLQPAANLLLIFLAVVWVADTAAYLAGRRWGRRKLAPSISPGKTWEGVAGAALAVAVYYVALQLTLRPEHPLLSGAAGALAFAAVTLLSIEGDLFESWMKRQAGVKDSGQLLPGHGGLLDRIDGLTAAIPIVALALHYFPR